MQADRQTYMLTAILCTTTGGQKSKDGENWIEHNQRILIGLIWKKKSDALRDLLGFAPVSPVIEKGGLRRFGHVDRTDDTNWTKRCTMIQAGVRRRGQLRKTWLVAWHSDRTSVYDWRTFPVLRSTCSWLVTTYVGKPSATRLADQANLAFHPFEVEKWVVSCNRMCATSLGWRHLSPNTDFRLSYSRRKCCPLC